MADEVLKEITINEPWYKKVWRPAAAFIYLGICLFDFAIMPAVIEYSNEEHNMAKIITEAKKFDDPAVQMDVIEKFAKNRTWEPLTLRDGAFFHIAFGALLTGAAVTRGMQNRDSVKNGKTPV